MEVTVVLAGAEGVAAGSLEAVVALCRGTCKQCSQSLAQIL